MNHRTRLDWLYFKLALWRMNPWLMTSYRIALKELLRHAPGTGFGMQGLQYVFLRRDVKIDFPRITKAVEYYADMKQSYQILMFPEGTDKTEYTTRRSNEYAKKNGLPELKNLLYPRIAGFIHLVNEMRKNNYLSYIYDVTVAYPKDIVQNETDLILKGRCSTSVHYHIRKIPISSIPADETELSNWLMDIWRQKDEILGQFYSQPLKNKRKLDASGGSRNLWAKDTGKQTFVYVFGFIFWVSVVSIWLWHMTFLNSVRLTFVFLILNYIYIYGRYGGVDYLLLERWEIWKKRTSCVV
uniref:Phospholipid/glycerol acyltransferase domain-containing protein n=1 Tax=Panagrolaimus davidi TaxID=227884 RepID=A0A914QC88_9BILA